MSKCQNRDNASASETRSRGLDVYSACINKASIIKEYKAKIVRLVV